MNGPNIFLSYRRADAQALAGRIADHLEQRLSDSTVFYDVDSIVVGTNFRRAIEEALHRSDVLVAVVDRRWLDTIPDGTRRLDAPDDFVALELRTAARLGVPVVPVLEPGAGLPTAAGLPPDLAWFADQQVFVLHADVDFDDEMNRLTGQLHALLPAGSSIEPVSRQILRAPRHRFVRLAIGLAAVLAAALLALVVVRSLGRINSSANPHAGSSAAASAGSTGQFVASGPWRLTVEGANAVGGGCRVALTNRDSGSTWETPTTYSDDTYQQHETGTISWRANDPRCIVSQLEGHGQHDLPLYQRLGGSDTLAFQPGGAASVAVTDFNGNPSCTLVLVDADTGDELDSAQASPGHGAVSLRTQGRPWVYLAHSYCSVRITPG